MAGCVGNNFVENFKAISGCKVNQLKVTKGTSGWLSNIIPSVKSERGILLVINLSNVSGVCSVADDCCIVM